MPGTFQACGATQACKVLGLHMLQQLSWQQLFASTAGTTTKSASGAGASCACAPRPKTDTADGVHGTGLFNQELCNQALLVFYELLGAGAQRAQHVTHSVQTIQTHRAQRAAQKVALSRQGRGPQRACSATLLSARWRCTAAHSMSSSLPSAPRRSRACACWVSRSHMPVSTACQ